MFIQIGVTCNTPDVCFPICTPTLAVSGVKLYLFPLVLVCLYDLRVGSCDPYLYELVMYGSLEPLNKVLEL